MQQNMRLLLENIDSISDNNVQPSIVAEDTLATSIIEEWNNFKNQDLLVEQGMPVMPPQAQIPIGTPQTQKPKPDPRAVGVLTQIKAATRNPRINVPATAAAMAKANAGQPLSRKEQLDMATFNQAVGGAAQQAVLNPITARQTITAIKSSQQAQRDAQARALRAQRGQKRGQ